MLTYADVCGRMLAYADVCWRILGEGPYSIVPRQREFAAHLGVLNDKLEEMIVLARSFKNEEDLSSLEKRDYSNIKVHICTYI